MLRIKTVRRQLHELLGNLVTLTVEPLEGHDHCVSIKVCFKENTIQYGLKPHGCEYKVEAGIMCKKGMMWWGAPCHWASAIREIAEDVLKRWIPLCGNAA